MGGERYDGGPSYPNTRWENITPSISFNLSSSHRRRHRLVVFLFFIFLFFLLLFYFFSHLSLRCRRLHRSIHIICVCISLLNHLIPKFNHPFPNYIIYTHIFFTHWYYFISYSFLHHFHLSPFLQHTSRTRHRHLHPYCTPLFHIRMFSVNPERRGILCNTYMYPAQYFVMYRYR